jgi:hypothetical protein
LKFIYILHSSPFKIQSKKIRKGINLKHKPLLMLLILALLSLAGLTILATTSPQTPTVLNYTSLGVNNNNLVYSKSVQPSILFITNGSNNYFNDWNNTLQAQGFTVTQVDLETLVGNPIIASPFDILILDTSCQGLTQNQSQIIAGTGKPVLAVGNGGYVFLNNLGAQITPLQVTQVTGVHILSISTSYNNWDAHYHIVYQYPNRVSYNISCLYGQVTQRYFLLPLNNDSLTLANSSNLIPLAEDTTEANNYFLSIYNNYSINPYLVQWALNNITTISQDPNGNSILQTLTNTLYWLKNKTPYSVQIMPDYYEYNASEVANISIAARSNLNLTFCGGINLSVNILDQNQNTVYTDQVVTSSGGPVYISCQIPAIPSTSYTINVTDGSLFFVESFIVQPTDYQITEFNATPSTIYLGGGAVMLNACVTVNGTSASEAIVYWSMINQITYPNAAFSSNFSLYTILGSGVTNNSGYAAYNWVPEETGIYEIVAWIQNYTGQPMNWTAAQVTVRGEPTLSVNLTGTDSGITVGDTLNFEGNLTLCSQPLGDSVSINVTIYCPDGSVVNYTVYTDSAGLFSLEWTPSTRGVYSIFFTSQGNLTMDSVTEGLEFSASQLVAGLETNAVNGQITLGESLQIIANFSSLGFTPQLNDPVTLLVTDLNNNTVFSNDYTIYNLDYFQTQWTPQYIGEYNVMLQFNQSYIIATPSSTIQVTSPGSNSASLNVLAGLSLVGSNNSGFTLPGALTVTGVGLLGSIVLFTRLMKNRNEFLDNWLHGGSNTRETKERWDDEEG